MSLRSLSCPTFPHWFFLRSRRTGWRTKGPKLEKDLFEAPPWSVASSSSVCKGSFSHGAVSSLGWAQEGGEWQSAVRLCPWSVLCGGRSIGVLALWAKINVVQFLFPSVFGIILVPGVCPCSLNFCWELSVSVRSRTFMITCLQFVFSSRLDYLGLFFGGGGVHFTFPLLFFHLLL